MNGDPINRREFVLRTVGAVSAVAAHAGSAAAPPARNVVLLIADDHGLDTPSYGNPRIKTPNLER
ncbi:MAG: twin-arginine translocation pathway signal protein, partial [bacterium]